MVVIIVLTGSCSGSSARSSPCRGRGADLADGTPHVALRRGHRRDDLGGRARGARRVPARPDPHPVDQPAGPAGPRARRRPVSSPAPSAREGLDPEVLEPVPGRGNVVAPPPRRRHGRRPAPAAAPPRRRAGQSRRRLDPRPVRRRRRRRLRLGPRRRGHEADGGARDRRGRAPGPPRPRRRPRPRARPDPRPAPRRALRLHRRRGGRGPRRCALARGASPRDAARRGRAQRGRWRVRGAGRAPLLPDPGRREGLRGLPDPRPRHLGPRLHAPRGQCRRDGRGGGPPPREPGRAAPHRR